MADEKQDLRVKKTKLALSTAMLTLLEKNSFSKITVNDICTSALVSRSAFYVHFEDKYALLNFCIELLKTQMFEESEGRSVETRIRKVLENVQSNVKIFKNVVMSDLDTELHKMMQKSFGSNFIGMLKEKEKEGLVLPCPAEIISAYHAAGIASCIMMWVENNMKQSTEEMAKYLCSMLPPLFIEFG